MMFWELIVVKICAPLQEKEEKGILEIKFFYDYFSVE